MATDRLEELFDRYLDGALSAEEEAQLAALLADPGAQERWRMLASLEGKLLEELMAPREEAALTGSESPLSDSAGKPPRPISRRRVRPVTRRGPLWTYGLVAAGVLVGLTAVLMVLTSGPTPPGPKEVRPSARTGPEKPSEGRPAGAREEDRRRAEAERKAAEERLREIERERQKLLAKSAAPEEKAFADLEDRKRRIEEEMRAAIERERAAQAGATNPTVQTPIPVPKAPQEKKPGEGTQAAVAVVERAEGEVFTEGKVAVQAKQEIPAGQGMETGANGLAVVRFPDKTEVELRGETKVREFKAEGGKRLWVERGTLTARVTKQPPGEPMRIETPHGEVSVLGTTLRIVVDPDPKKGTRLEVEEGKVELKRKLDGKTVDVVSGHYAVAAAGVELLAHVTYLLAENFDDAREFASRWQTYTSGLPDRTSVEEGFLRMRPGNAGSSWESWYAATRKSFPLGRLRVSARIRYSHATPLLVGAISLFSELDSGRGDRDHIELTVRDGVLAVKSMRYEKGSDVGTHKMTPPAGAKIGGPKQWIAVDLIVDRQNVRVNVDGVELYSGPHKIVNYQRVRLVLEAQHRVGTGEPYLVEFDDVRVQDMR